MGRRTKLFFIEASVVRGSDLPSPGTPRGEGEESWSGGALPSFSENSSSGLSPVLCFVLYKGFQVVLAILAFITAFPVHSQLLPKLKATPIRLVSYTG